MIFEVKYFSQYILLPDQISLSGFLYFLRYYSNDCCTCSFSRFWRHKFWTWLYLSNQAVFLHVQKVKEKFKYLENEKSFHNEIKSIFHQFQRLSFNQLKGENLTLSYTNQLFNFFWCIFPKVSCESRKIIPFRFDYVLCIFSKAGSFAFNLWPELQKESDCVIQFSLFLVSYSKNN